jgi:acetyl esterase/lipase
MAFKAVDGICYPTQNMMKFPDVVSKRDISYGEYSMNKMDLYYHKDILNDGQLHPVILYIHGGGFIMGDKKCRVSISEYYADKGYFVCCLNYRMPPEVSFPEITHDFVNGFNYVKKLSEKYNIDLDNVFVTGDSSGAFSTSYLAAIKYNDDLRECLGVPELELDIKGIMLMCGIYDVEVLLQGSKLFGVIPKTAQMLVGDFPLKKDLSNFRDFPFYKEIAPANYVNEKWCPVFICWAEDDLVCQNQGEPMAEKLKDVVPYFDSFSVKGIQNNHCFHLECGHNKLAMECMERSADFVAKVVEMETVTK